MTKSNSIPCGMELFRYAFRSKHLAHHLKNPPETGLGTSIAWLWGGRLMGWQWRWPAWTRPTQTMGFFARFVGRLPVGRKLLLIYLLDLSAVLYVSGILIHEKFISIDFARKEVAGSAYISAVRDTLLAVPLPLSDHAAVRALAPPPLLASDAAARMAQAEEAYGHDMMTAEPSQDLAQALQEAQGQPPSRAQYSRIEDAGRALITRLGNQSNLILDPDLDSYYTMSLVLLRFPELQELLGLMAQKSVELLHSPGARRQLLTTEYLILEGRLDAVVKGIESDYAEAWAANTTDLRAALAPSHQALGEALRGFRRVLAEHNSKDRAGQVRRVAAEHQATLRQVQQAWQAASHGLEQLLEARIAQQFSRMWLHLGTAAGLLMVILALVYFVARQISGPIRTLAGVASEVSRTGDFSLRANHVSPDEIGKLVTAFNSMLGELDRSRALREDLAATARAAEAQRLLVEAFPTPLIVTSIPDHRVLHANQPALPWLGELRTDPWLVGLDAPARARYFQQLNDQGEVDGFEVLWQTPATQGSAGNREWALLSGRRLSFLGQDALLTAFTPIGQIKRLEQRLQLWAKVFEASSESMLILDVDRRLLTANRAFVRTGGWDLEEVMGQTPDFLYSDRHAPEFYDTLWQSTIIRGSWQGEVWLKRKNGEVYPTWMVANVVRSPDGHLTHLVASCVDISEHKRNEARIHHLAHHDVLTDLPNRSLCTERLRMALEQAKRSGAMVGVVFIDLDRFKNINDSMGHHIGDGLLTSVSQRLQSAVRGGDTVSRLGGDEFVVVLAAAHSRQEIHDVVAGRIVPLIREPHEVEGVELHISCSAGMAVYPDDGRDVDTLMRNADAAMYQSKAAGRNTALFFTPEFLAQAQERVVIEIALRGAIERGELRLYYQPRVEAATGHVMGLEALVRWQPEGGDMVSPAKFIPIAEETGQIIPLGAWILNEACRQHVAWREAGLGVLPISINVSAVQLKDPHLPDLLAQALHTHGVQPAAIELELTESFLMENALATIQTLEKLKAQGVSLSIDDFGTGYSSLNYLHQFPIDKLKIDQSFVRDMLDDPADLAITKAIIGLGHTLGLRVVAEGVEHEPEANLLRAAGCDELQGYLFSKPMPAADVPTWLAGRPLAASRPALS